MSEVGSSFFVSHRRYSLVLVHNSLHKQSRIFVTNLDPALSSLVSSYHLSISNISCTFLGLTKKREQEKKSKSKYDFQPGCFIQV
uniref:Uncharacterized protein n=1 Tax=Helianthus annuus TaxID=4232 RepID=A0A2P1MA54_HELAN|nr:hypothetical protein [Helianthus annuus]